MLLLHIAQPTRSMRHSLTFRAARQIIVGSFIVFALLWSIRRGIAFRNIAQNGEIAKRLRKIFRFGNCSNTRAPVPC